RALAKLRDPVPVNFDNNRLVNVIDYLRNTTGLNFVVQWAALSAAGVEQDKTVTLQLNNVAADKVLELVLQQVSTDEANPISYTVRDGIVVISTRRDLTRSTDLRKYDIRDLLVNVPNYDDQPDFDLNTALGGNVGRGGGSARGIASQGTQT